MSAPARVATELRGYRDPVVPRSRALGPVIAIGAVLLLVTVPTVSVVLVGDSSYVSLSRAYPGLLTSILSASLRAIAEVSSWITIGAIVSLLFLRTTPGATRLVIDNEFESRIGRAAALVWAVSALALVPVDAADASGQSLTRLLVPGALSFLIQAAYLPTAWIVVTLLATIAYFLLAFSSRWASLLPALLVSGLGLLAPVVVGQVLVGPDHDLGSDSAILGTPAAAVLVGSVAVFAIRLLSGRLIRPDTLRRFGLLAMITWPMIVGSEILIAGFKLVGPDPWSTPTAALIIVRLSVLLVMGILLGVGIGRWRRGGLTRRILAIVVGATALLGLVFVLVGVVMTRIPPPQYFVPTSVSQIMLGFDVDAAPTFAVLATNWRLNLLFAVLSAAAVTVYLLAYLRVRARGIAWPTNRLVSWILGWVVVVVATSSGFGKYSGADFGVHMIVHMALNMLAPLLLVMGGFVTLLLRASTPSGPAGRAGLHEWIVAALGSPALRVLFNPLLVFALFITSYYGLYFTGLFGEAMRFHWAHQAMNLHFLGVGYLYYSLVIGVDRPPRPLPYLGRLGFVFAAMPFHAFFGIILMTSTVIYAQDFYDNLWLPWADLPASQYAGGGIAWAGGELPLIIVIIALSIQWSRQDERESIRTDRHLDTGRDEDFASYNVMLQRLAERRGAAAEKDSP